MKELFERQEEEILPRTWRERAVCKGWPSRNCNILRGVHLTCSIPRGRNLREMGISVLLSSFTLLVLALGPPNWEPCTGEAGCITGQPLEHSTVSKVGECRSGGQKGDTQSTHMYGLHMMYQGLLHLPGQDTSTSEGQASIAGRILRPQCTAASYVEVNGSRLSPPSPLAPSLEDAPQLPHSGLPETFPTLISHNKLPAPTCFPKCTISYCQV